MSDDLRVMNRPSNSLRRGSVGIASACAMAAAAMIASPALASDHLLISEVVAAPAAGEYIEIYNPLNVPVDLSNYYLADNPLYGRVPCPISFPANGDFIARFPPGATIPAGGVVTVAFIADNYIATYGSSPNFEFPSGLGNPGVPDMLSAYVGSIGFSPGVADAGEWIVLFHWDQNSDLVDDVDMIRLGTPAAGDQISSKHTLCVDGPDNKEACIPGDCSNYLHDGFTMPSMGVTAGAGFSFKRRYLEGGHETPCNGNGITGHDESTENILVTWDSGVGFTAPTPGSAPVLTEPPGSCSADTNGSGAVDVDDLIAVILSWGPCADCFACPADVAPACNDCEVNVDDLIAVILGWGPCP